MVRFKSLFILIQILISIFISPSHQSANIALQPPFSKFGSIARNDKLKVLMIIEPSPFSHISGYSTRFKHTISELTKLGVHVDIICPEIYPAKSVYPVFSGCKIHPITGQRSPAYKAVVLSFDRYLQAYDITYRLKPDIIHVTSPGMLVLSANALSKTFDIPLVVSYHTNLMMYAKKYGPWIPFVYRYIRGYMEHIHNSAACSLVTSPQMKQELESYGVKRIHLWPKGVDSIAFSPSHYSSDMRRRMIDSSDGRDHDGKFLLLYVGRIAREKQLADLIPVLDSNPSLRLCIVGSGPYDIELKRRLKNSNKVVFMGELKGDALSQAYASSDLFVIPSRSETLGLVALEAISSGIPVVGANAGGLRDIVKNGSTGFLYDAGSPLSLLYYVNELQRNATMMKEMKANCRNEGEKFSWSESVKYLHEKVYLPLINN